MWKIHHVYVDHFPNGKPGIRQNGSTTKPFLRYHPVPQISLHDSKCHTQNSTHDLTKVAPPYGYKWRTWGSLCCGISKFPPVNTHDWLKIPHAYNVHLLSHLHPKKANAPDKQVFFYTDSLVIISFQCDQCRPHCSLFV